MISGGLGPPPETANATSPTFPIREGGSTFIVAPGHEEPEIEYIVVSHSGVSVVVKRGEAAALAEETNPRD